MSATSREDLSDVLDAIREVGQSLDRRARRASAVTMMAWGLAASASLLFYHLVRVNPEPIFALLGDAGVRWFWVGPSLLAYVASALVGTRLGRAAPDAGAVRAIRWVLVALLVPFALVVYVTLTGQGGERVPGMWVLFLAFPYLRWRDTPQGRTSRFDRLASASSIAAGLALLVLAPTWGFLAAALWYLALLFLAGAVRYHLASR